VIHAGGKGERLHPITLSIPKPLIEIGIHKKPLIYWSMLPAIEYGIKRFVITTNYMSEKIEKFFETREWKDFDITVFREEEKLGSAGATKCCIEEGIIGKKDLVLMQNASDIIRNFLPKLLAFHEEHVKKGFEATIVTAQKFIVPSSKVEYDLKTYAVKSLRRRPELVWRDGEGSHVGMFVFSPTSLERFMSVKIPSNPEDSVVQDLIGEKRACAFVTDSWIPIKYASDVSAVNELDLRKFILG